MWGWLNVLVARENPKRKKVVDIKLPKMSVAFSAFLAVLIFLLLDIHFLRHLQQLLTVDRHDGYRLLWKMLVTLKESMSEANKSAMTVIASFLRAMLRCHFFRKEDVVTTAGCWNIIKRMAPDALAFYTADCVKWWECPHENPTGYGLFQYRTAIVEIPAGSRWIATDENNDISGEWEIPGQCERVRKCRKKDDETRLRCQYTPTFRSMTIENDCEHHFIARFLGGCDQVLFDRISKGSCVWFDGHAWAVWGGIFKFGRAARRRTDCCYLVPHKSSAQKPYIWVRFNSNTGSLQENHFEITAKNCYELMFVRPPKGCWCGEYNDWTMHSCTRRGGCKGQGHEECIRLNNDKWGKKWTRGIGCGRCDDNFNQ